MRIVYPKKMKTEFVLFLAELKNGCIRIPEEIVADLGDKFRVRVMIEIRESKIIKGTGVAKKRRFSVLGSRALKKRPTA